MKKFFAQLLLLTFSWQSLGYTAPLPSQQNNLSGEGVSAGDLIHAGQTADDLVANRNAVQSFSLQAQSLPATNSTQIANWILQQQSLYASGLVVSHPEDTSSITVNSQQVFLNTQAFTYDQAIAGIALLNEGSLADAKRIFDFYYTIYNSNVAGFIGVNGGFNSVYNADPAKQSLVYEYKKGTGENAWIALFALQYQLATTDAAEKDKALAMATAIGKWIAGIPHVNGVPPVTREQNPVQDPNFGKIVSTENVLDYYAVLKNLVGSKLSTADRNLFTAELQNTKNWLKTQAFDPQTYLFRRGGNTINGPFAWDPVASLDVNSWAVTALGPATLAEDFGINLKDFMGAIAENFAVQGDGSFRGDISQAKGFDYSDKANAQASGRTGIKWVEGTNQMILAYRNVGDYLVNRDAVSAAQYHTLADHLDSHNGDNGSLTGNLLSYLQADSPGAQIYSDAGNVRVSSGASAASAAWAAPVIRRSSSSSTISPT